MLPSEPQEPNLESSASPSDRIVSTTFRTSHPNTKLAQERDVGRAFAKAYEQKMGIRLKELSKSGDRPDLLYECGTLRYGVELFEKDQLYSERALAYALTNEIYAEIERRNLGDRYVGLAMDIPILIKHDWDAAVKGQWKAKGIQTCARETVDFLVNTAASPNDIPHITKAKPLEVSQEKYPALAVISRHLWIGQCNPEDERRSDKRAAPLVLIGGSYQFYTEEIIAELISKIAEKTTLRRKWPPVDRAILVIHDLPRAHFLGVVPKWVDLLRIELNSNRDISKGFDEVWSVSYLATGMPIGEGLAQRLC